MAIADGHEDRPTTMELAYSAARRGRIAEVDRLLDELRDATGHDLADLADELHRMAECVRAHPSYDERSASALEAN